MGVDVVRSSVITIRGRVLRPITPLKYSQDYMFEQRSHIRKDRQDRNLNGHRRIRLFNGGLESDESRQWQGNPSV